MNKWLIIGGVVILAGIGAVLFMQSQNQQQPATNTTTQVTPTVAHEMTDEEHDESMMSPAPTGEEVSSESTEDVKSGQVVTVKVVGDNFKFDKKEITVKKGDTVRIEFVNSGGLHDWVLDGYGKDIRTKQIQANQTDTVEFVADKAGEFEYYCSVGQHRQMGMVGTLIVTE